MTYLEERGEFDRWPFGDPEEIDTIVDKLLWAFYAKPTADGYDLTEYEAKCGDEKIVDELRKHIEAIVDCLWDYMREK